MKQGVLIQNILYKSIRIAQYINFCYFLKVDVPPRKKERLTAVAYYYKWLFDMEGFDYTKFNPEWLHHHYTAYYKKQFRASAVLKSHLLKGIAEGQFGEYKQWFIVTYCSDEKK